MASDTDIDELKRMCTVLFLELQEVRRRLDIEPVDLQESSETSLRFDRDLRRFDERLRRLSDQRAGKTVAPRPAKGA